MKESRALGSRVWDGRWDVGWDLQHADGGDLERK